MTIGSGIGASDAAEGEPGRAGWGALAFGMTLTAFLAAAVALARVNNSPGSSDSIGNLVGARSLVRGRGFISEGVGQFWVRQALPGPETVRPPGLPYLLAALFKIAGVSLAVPVLLNAAAVALGTIALRVAIARSAGRTAGDLAGVLVLLSYDYEMASIWNNNLLTACTAALLLLGTTRGGARRTVLLALVAAAGFLLKPTFVLNAIPFGLLVLGLDGGRSWRRRAADVAGFLGIYLVLTSVYWGPNLRLYGTPLYSPSFTSSRLELRYNVLGERSWRAVRFDRPMTYTEVIARLGLAKMLVVDAKEVAKTAFYAVCLNPAVAVVAAGLIVFGRRERRRDYAGPILLMAGTFFEVGIYNHHEFRYLWPMYPCLLYLAGTTVRDFGAWGRFQMTPLLADRFRLLMRLLVVGAIGIGGVGALETWRKSFQTARVPTPTWVKSVAALPDSAVILTLDPGAVLWWADRRAVMCPLGDRADLETIVNFYHPDAYLALGEPTGGPDGVAIRPGELASLARGAGWSLFRIEGPLGANPRSRRESLKSRPDSVDQGDTSS